MCHRDVVTFARRVLSLFIIPLQFGKNMAFTAAEPRVGTDMLPPRNCSSLLFLSRRDHEPQAVSKDAARVLSNSSPISR